MIEVQYKRDRTTLGNFANVSEKGIAHKIMFAGIMIFWNLRTLETLSTSL